MKLSVLCCGIFRTGSINSFSCTTGFDLVSCEDLVALVGRFETTLREGLFFGLVVVGFFTDLVGGVADFTPLPAFFAVNGTEAVLISPSRSSVGCS